MDRYGSLYPARFLRCARAAHAIMLAVRPVLDPLSGQCRGTGRAPPEQSALLEGIGQLEELCFAEGPAEKLHADRNTDGSAVGGGRESAWHRDGGQSSARRHEAIAFQLHCIGARRHHEPALVRVEQGIESVAVHYGDQCVSEADLPAETRYVLRIPADSVSLLQAEPERFVRRWKRVGRGGDGFRQRVISGAGTGPRNVSVKR